MPVSKREFLKIAGVSALSAAVGRKVKAGVPGRVEPNPHALTATRWAMVIDTRKCKEGCAKCQEACHREHNVPHIPNPKHEIKWIWTEEFKHCFPMTEKEAELLPEKLEKRPFLTLCNHCDHPPCVRVCPTQATFKRKSDGIVMMDYHRCIGCRFCMAACPYGSRSFNFEDPRKYLEKEKMNPRYPTRMKGVVEKCNFCAERLAKGQLPACVLACDRGALVFGDLDDKNSEVHRLVKEHFTLRRKPELGTFPMVYYIV